MPPRAWPRHGDGSATLSVDAGGAGRNCDAALDGEEANTKKTFVWEEAVFDGRARTCLRRGDRKVVERSQTEEALGRGAGESSLTACDTLFATGITYRDLISSRVGVRILPSQGDCTWWSIVEATISCLCIPVVFPYILSPSIISPASVSSTIWRLRIHVVLILLSWRTSVLVLCYFRMRPRWWRRLVFFFFLFSFSVMPVRSPLAYKVVARVVKLGRKLIDALESKLL